MGRKYYCDYCDKRLPSGINHRKNHNRGIQHISNKRIYYQQFKGWEKDFIVMNEEMFVFRSYGDFIRGTIEENL